MKAYKYRGGNDEIFERDVLSLQNNFFWSPQIKDLNDPCEALIESEQYKPKLELIINAFRVKDNPQVKEAFDVFQRSLAGVLNKIQSVGVFSLSKTYTDELLWAHYASSHKGFCVEYDTEVLTKNKPYGFDLLDVH